MSFFDKLTKSIRDSLQGDVDSIMKTDADMVPDKPDQTQQHDGSIGSKALLQDPYFDQMQQHFIFKHKASRITNKTLKDVSLRDWVVSAIMQARVDTMLQFSRPQRKQFDMGFKLCKKNLDDNLTAEEKEEIKNLEDFIYNCGRHKGTPPGDEMLFGEFLKLITRDALTFGHIAVEKILTRKKGLHRFRPRPAESVYLINQKTSRAIIEREVKQAQLMRQNYNKNLASNDPSATYEVNEPDIDYYKYVQMSYDNRVLAAFGEEDMIFRLANPQNFSDSMGYCYSPLELAIINVTNHMNISTYNANFFTYGQAAKGVLHLKGTVTQAQLTAFRRQFYNTISGAQHAWRTPIIAGLDDIQWVPLAGSSKEMEYMSYDNNVTRAICTQFQIDPMELGLDFLVSGNGRAPSQQANNEFKITYSRERGLIPLLMTIEDMINRDILPVLDPDLANKYIFKFTGYTDETPQTNIALMQAEMTVHSTMNDLLKSVNKESVSHPVFNVPLNQAFWQIVKENMTKGEIRETFFGDKDASKRRELQYISADNAFLAWNQMLLTMDRMKRQDTIQAKQMKHEQEQEKQQAEQTQDQHEMAMNESGARHAHGVVQQQSTKDIAKDVGAATSALNIEGTPTANPFNTLGDE